MKILLATITILLCSQLQAKQKYYKWKDSDGNIHYSAEKPEDRTTQEIKVNTNQPIIVTHNEKENESSSNPALTTQEKIAKHYKDKENTRATAKEKDKECTIARARYSKFNQAVRFSRKDSTTGEYTYLADDQKTELLKELKKTIKRMCK